MNKIYKEIILERLSLAKESLSRIINQNDRERLLNPIIEDIYVKFNDLLTEENIRVEDLMTSSNDVEFKTAVNMVRNVSKYEDLISVLYRNLCDVFAKEYSTDQDIMFSRKWSDFIISEIDKNSNKLLDYKNLDIKRMLKTVIQEFGGVDV